MNRRVALVAATNNLAVEMNAQEILRQFQPECLSKPLAVNVEKFFEGRLPKIAKVSTDYQKTSNGIFGWTSSEKMEAVIALDLIETSDNNRRRQGRATIVHESSHAIHHIPQFIKQKNILQSIHDNNHNSVRLFRQEDIPAYMNAEWQAWRWGKAFIMPLPIILELHKKGCSPFEMAEIFDVNPAFVKSRLGDLQRWGKI